MIREHHPQVADWRRRSVKCREHAVRTAQFQPPLTWNRIPAGMLVDWLNSADFARCFFYYTGCSLSFFIRQKRKEEPCRAGRRVTASSTRATILHRCLRGVPAHQHPLQSLARLQGETPRHSLSLLAFQIATWSMQIVGKKQFKTTNAPMHIEDQGQIGKITLWRVTWDTSSSCLVLHRRRTICDTCHFNGRQNGPHLKTCITNAARIAFA